MKIPVYEKDGETQATSKSGTPQEIHSVDAHAWSSMDDGNAWTLMVVTERVNGKTENKTVGIRPKTKKDFEDKALAADNALAKAVKNAKDAKTALEVKTAANPTDGRVAPVRTSKTK